MLCFNTEWDQAASQGLSVGVAAVKAVEPGSSGRPLATDCRRPPDDHTADRPIRKRPFAGRQGYPGQWPWRSIGKLAAYGLTLPGLAVYGDVGGLWKTLGCLGVFSGREGARCTIDRQDRQLHGRGAPHSASAPRLGSTLRVHDPEGNWSLSDSHSDQRVPDAHHVTDHMIRLPHAPCQHGRCRHQENHGWQHAPGHGDACQRLSTHVTQTRRYFLPIRQVRSAGTVAVIDRVASGCPVFCRHARTRRTNPQHLTGADIAWRPVAIRDQPWPAPDAIPLKPVISIRAPKVHRSKRSKSPWARPRLAPGACGSEYLATRVRPTAAGGTQPPPAAPSPRPGRPPPPGWP